MPEEELLKKYANEIGKLRKRAKKLNLSDEEVNKLFKQCFDVIKSNTEVSNSNCKAQKILITFLKGLLILLGVLIIFYVLLNVHQPTASVVLRNVQSLIYPGFSLLRYISVPIIKRFPSLTGKVTQISLRRL